MRKLAQRAGLTGDKLGPHGFRHTKALQVLDSGGELMDLKESLGHRSINATMVYLRAYNSRHAAKKERELNPFGGWRL